MIKLSGKFHRVASIEAADPVSLAYTYTGKAEEVSRLKELAKWLAGLGKTPLARALAQLASDLEEGIALGVVSPGDTLYHTV